MTGRDYIHAWAAGFWDGEGSVYGRADQSAIVLAVTQAGDEGEALCRRFVEAVSTTGRVYGPYYYPKKSGKPYYRGFVQGYAAVKSALERCSPWLSETKKAQASAHLATYEARKAAYVHPSAAKTHCKQGHLYDEANTRYSNGKRRCLACRMARYYRQSTDPEQVARRREQDTAAHRRRRQAARVEEKQDEQQQQGRNEAAAA